MRSSFWRQITILPTLTLGLTVTSGCGDEWQDVLEDILENHHDHDGEDSDNSGGEEDDSSSEDDPDGRCDLPEGGDPLYDQRWYGEPGTALDDPRQKGYGICKDRDLSELLREITNRWPQLPVLAEGQSLFDPRFESEFLAWQTRAGGFAIAIADHRKRDCELNCRGPVWHYFATAGDGCELYRLGEYWTEWTKKDPCVYPHGEPRWGYPKAELPETMCSDAAQRPNDGDYFLAYLDGTWTSCEKGEPTDSRQVDRNVLIQLNHQDEGDTPRSVRIVGLPEGRADDLLFDSEVRAPRHVHGSASGEGESDHGVDSWKIAIHHLVGGCESGKFQVTREIAKDSKCGYYVGGLLRFPR